MAASDALAVHFLTGMHDIEAGRWNALAGTDYPFLRHEFLHLLERCGCCGQGSGWQPCHALLYRGDKLAALMPLYLKSHSYGEFVFDWNWAEAWHRHGVNYYPKLVTAVPFTPVTGPRLCLAEGESRERAYPAMAQAVRRFAAQNKLSSWHVLFPEAEDAAALRRAGTSLRVASQFHWFNRGYAAFDEFLATFNSRKRKSLRRERRRVGEQGARLEIKEGAEIGVADWERFHHYYRLTYAKRSGHGGYLNREFFLGLGDAIGEHCVMVVATQNGSAVAAALYFRSSDTLYGRYWGCERELDCLHFEACYYQGIEYCIRRGLRRFDPGAQGEHKIQRGFTPIKTCSNHWIADERLRAAVADFTERERAHVETYIDAASNHLPFRQAD